MQVLGQKPLISPRLYMYCKLVANIELKGPRPPGRQFIVNYCCIRVLMYAKILKETEKHKLFCHIFIIGVILNEGGKAPWPSSWLRLCLNHWRIQKILVGDDKNFKHKTSKIRTCCNQARSQKFAMLRLF